jgi:hypothetical protein
MEDKNAIGVSDKGETQLPLEFILFTTKDSCCCELFTGLEILIECYLEVDKGVLYSASCGLLLPPTPGVSSSFVPSSYHLD